MLVKVSGWGPNETLVGGDRVIGVGPDDILSDVVASLLEKVGHRGYTAPVELGKVRHGTFVPHDLQQSAKSAGLKQGSKLVLRRKMYSLDVDLDGTPMEMSPQRQRAKQKQTDRQAEPRPSQPSQPLPVSRPPPPTLRPVSRPLSDGVSIVREGAEPARMTYAPFTNIKNAVADARTAARSRSPGTPSTKMPTTLTPMLTSWLADRVTEQESQMQRRFQESGVLGESAEGVGADQARLIETIGQESVEATVAACRDAVGAETWTAFTEEYLSRSQKYVEAVEVDPITPVVSEGAEPPQLASLREVIGRCASSEVETLSYILGDVAEGSGQSRSFLEHIAEGRTGTALHFIAGDGVEAEEGARVEQDEGVRQAGAAVEALLCREEQIRNQLFAEGFSEEGPSSPRSKARFTERAVQIVHDVQRRVLCEVEEAESEARGTFVPEEAAAMRSLAEHEEVITRLTVQQALEQASDFTDLKETLSKQLCERQVAAQAHIPASALSHLETVLRTGDAPALGFIAGRGEHLRSVISADGAEHPAADFILSGEVPHDTTDISADVATLVASEEQVRAELFAASFADDAPSSPRSRERFVETAVQIVHHHKVTRLVETETQARETVFGDVQASEVSLLVAQEDVTRSLVEIELSRTEDLETMKARLVTLVRQRQAELQAGTPWLDAVRGESTSATALGFVSGDVQEVDTSRLDALVATEEQIRNDLFAEGFSEEGPSSPRSKARFTERAVQIVHDVQRRVLCEVEEAESEARDTFVPEEAAAMRSLVEHEEVITRLTVQQALEKASDFTDLKETLSKQLCERQVAAQAHVPSSAQSHLVTVLSTGDAPALGFIAGRGEHLRSVIAADGAEYPAADFILSREVPHDTTDISADVATLVASEEQVRAKLFAASFSDDAPSSPRSRARFVETAVQIVHHHKVTRLAESETQARETVFSDLQASEVSLLVAQEDVTRSLVEIELSRTEDLETMKARLVTLVRQRQAELQIGQAPVPVTTEAHLEAVLSTGDAPALSFIAGRGEHLRSVIAADGAEHPAADFILAAGVPPGTTDISAEVATLAEEQVRAELFAASFSDDAPANSRSRARFVETAVQIVHRHKVARLAETETQARETVFGDVQASEVSLLVAQEDVTRSLVEIELSRTEDLETMKARLVTLVRQRQAELQAGTPWLDAMRGVSTSATALGFVSGDVQEVDTSRLDSLVATEEQIRNDLFAEGFSEEGPSSPRSKARFTERAVQIVHDVQRRFLCEVEEAESEARGTFVPEEAAAMRSLVEHEEVITRLTVQQALEKASDFTDLKETLSKQLCERQVAAQAHIPASALSHLETVLSTGDASALGFIAGRGEHLRSVITADGAEQPAADFILSREVPHDTTDISAPVATLVASEEQVRTELFADSFADDAPSSPRSRARFVETAVQIVHRHKVTQLAETETQARETVFGDVRASEVSLLVAQEDVTRSLVEIELSRTEDLETMKARLVTLVRQRQAELQAGTPWLDAMRGESTSATALGFVSGDVQEVDTSRLDALVATEEQIRNDLFAEGFSEEGPSSPRSKARFTERAVQIVHDVQRRFLCEVEEAESEARGAFVPEEAAAMRSLVEHEEVITRLTVQQALEKASDFTDLKETLSKQLCERQVAAQAHIPASALSHLETVLSTGDASALGFIAGRGEHLRSVITADGAEHPAADFILSREVPHDTTDISAAVATLVASEEQVRTELFADSFADDAPSSPRSRARFVETAVQIVHRHKVTQLAETETHARETVFGDVRASEVSLLVAQEDVTRSLVEIELSRTEDLETMKARLVTLVRQRQAELQAGTPWLDAMRGESTSATALGFVSGDVEEVDTSRLDALVATEEQIRYDLFAEGFSEEGPSSPRSKARFTERAVQIVHDVQRRVLCEVEEAESEARGTFVPEEAAAMRSLVEHEEVITRLTVQQALEKASDFTDLKETLSKQLCERQVAAQAHIPASAQSHLETVLSTGDAPALGFIAGRGEHLRSVIAADGAEHPAADFILSREVPHDTTDISADVATLVASEEQVRAELFAASFSDDAPSSPRSHERFVDTAVQLVHHHKVAQLAESETLARGHVVGDVQASELSLLVAQEDVTRSLVEIELSHTEDLETMKARLITLVRQRQAELQAGTPWLDAMRGESTSATALGFVSGDVQEVDTSRLDALVATEEQIRNDLFAEGFSEEGPSSPRSKARFTERAVQIVHDVQRRVLCKVEEAESEARGTFVPEEAAAMRSLVEHEEVITRLTVQQALEKASDFTDLKETLSKQLCERQIAAQAHIPSSAQAHLETVRSTGDAPALGFIAGRGEHLRSAMAADGAEHPAADFILSGEVPQVTTDISADVATLVASEEQVRAELFAASFSDDAPSSPRSHERFVESAVQIVHHHKVTQLAETETQVRETVFGDVQASEVSLFVAQEDVTRSLVEIELSRTEDLETMKARLVTLVRQRQAELQAGTPWLDAMRGESTSATALGFVSGDVQEVDTSRLDALVATEEQIRLLHPAVQIVHDVQRRVLCEVEEAESEARDTFVPEEAAAMRSLVEHEEVITRLTVQQALEQASDFTDLKETLSKQLCERQVAAQAHIPASALSHLETVLRTGDAPALGFIAGRGEHLRSVISADGAEHPAADFILSGEVPHDTTDISADVATLVASEEQVRAELFAASFADDAPSSPRSRERFVETAVQIVHRHKVAELTETETEARETVFGDVQASEVSLLVAQEDVTRSLVEIELSRTEDLETMKARLVTLVRQRQAELQAGTPWLDAMRGESTSATALGFVSGDVQEVDTSRLDSLVATEEQFRNDLFAESFSEEGPSSPRSKARFTERAVQIVHALQRRVVSEGEQPAALDHRQLQAVVSTASSAVSSLAFVLDPALPGHASLDLVCSLGSGHALSLVAGHSPVCHEPISHLRDISAVTLPCACGADCDIVTDTPAVVLARRRLAYRLVVKDSKRTYVHWPSRRRVKHSHLERDLAKQPLTLSQELRHLAEWRYSTKHRYYENQKLKKTSHHPWRDVAKLSAADSSYPQWGRLAVSDALARDLGKVLQRAAARYSSWQEKKAKAAEKRCTRLDKQDLAAKALEKGKWKQVPVVGSDKFFFQKRNEKAWDLGAHLVGQEQDRKREKLGVDFFPPNCDKCSACFSSPPPRWECMDCAAHVWQPSVGLKSKWCHTCKKDISRMRGQDNCRLCGYISCRYCMENELPLLSMGWSGKTMCKVCRGCAANPGKKPEAT